MGEIGEGDQTANQTSKPLKKEKKKSLILEEYNCSLICSDVTLLASSPVCLCLLGRFGALLWRPDCEPGSVVIWQAWWVRDAAVSCRAGAKQGPRGRDPVGTWIQSS
jgi:hypothetical protein